MKMGLELVPFRGVAIEDGRFRAISADPWLELRLPSGFLGGWARLSYEASILDPLVRPVIRFETGQGPQDEHMAAPLFGRAEWVGRVPKGTRRVLISPVAEVGPFSFAVTAFDRVSRLSMLGRALLGDWEFAAMALGARLIGGRQEARQALAFAIGGRQIDTYDAWRARRVRRFDRASLDAPRFDWGTEGVPIVLVCRGPDWPREVLAGLLAALEAQPYPNWRVVLVGGEASSRFDGRVVSHPADQPLSELAAGLSDDALIGTIEPDLCLAESSLAILAESAHRQREALLFYGDEDCVDRDGRHHSPVLRPDWSPILIESVPYIGTTVFARASWMRESEGGLQAAVRKLGEREVVHVRRVLLTRFQERSASAPVENEYRDAAPEPRQAEGKPLATIIIPTKNRLDLIRKCVDSLLDLTVPRDFEVIIVDNGSSDEEVAAYYRAHAGDPRVAIVYCPGPFNYSAMCNAAAARARANLLVFLNNDTVVIEHFWLARLLAMAQRPDVGIVGARLLYPDRTIQHAGVVVGMGGYADHVHQHEPGDATGYFGRMQVPHELSAVTGACTAVERLKFDLVGGYDSDNLPVELNDIDLCLRLAARGFKSVIEPRCCLIHLHSASRGFSYRPFTRYARERAWFCQQWGRVLRDDPYYHPALSLFSVRPELDGW